MSILPAFKENDSFSIGVELELQLIDLHSFNLAMEAKDFLRRLDKIPHPGEIKPEITLSMIEINSSVHTDYESLNAELHLMKNTVAEEAARTHIGVCGGGAHLFQQWQEQRIYPMERFASASEQYGYLAKQFTVFGQHIHIGCKNGDDALYLCHAFSRYLPQFLALSAASPYQQGVDTRFDCSRLTVISAFPLSGMPPWLFQWSDFESYFENIYELGIVKSMKDFYWDIRPKPEFGTIEIRICDTPLTVDKAADLAAYAQMLADWLIETRPIVSSEVYLTYLNNRFSAARFGLNADFIDPVRRTKYTLLDEIQRSCEYLAPYAEKLGSRAVLDRIKQYAYLKENDACWIRKQQIKYQSLEDTVRKQTEIWCE